jgi:DNA-directed RNA polymerase specialized sigma24 family protein
VRSGTQRKLDLSYSQYVPRAFEFAWLLTRDEETATRMALRAWRRSMGSMLDLRGPDVLEARILRSIVSQARRARILHRPPGAEGFESEWLRLPARTRAALVLQELEEVDPRHVADILECSDATVASITSRGRKQLAGAEDEGHLRRRLEALAAEAPPPPPESQRIRRGAALRRLLTVAGTSLLVILIAAGAIAGTRAAVNRAANPPEPTADEEVSLDRGLRDRIEELRTSCPDERRFEALPRRGAVRAARVAVRFNDAVIRRDARSVRLLAEPSADPTRGTWAHTLSRKGVVVTSVRRVTREDLFSVACGRDVTKKSLRVVIHDRNGVTSEGIAFFYLAYTKGGWRVWAGDEPGA